MIVIRSSAFDRERSERALHEAKNELVGLVGALALEPMLKRLKQLVRDAREQKKVRGALSFPAVCAIMSGAVIPTVRAQLKDAAIGFTYSWYSLDSLQLHGSSLGLQLDREEIMPRLVSPSPASPAGLAELLMHLLSLLSLLRSYLPHDA